MTIEQNGNPYSDCVKKEIKILDIGGSHNPKSDATHIIDFDATIRSNQNYKFNYKRNIQ